MAEAQPAAERAGRGGSCPFQKSRSDFMSSNTFMSSVAILRSQDELAGGHTPSSRNQPCSAQGLRYSYFSSSMLKLRDSASGRGHWGMAELVPQLAKPLPEGLMLAGHPGTSVLKQKKSPPFPPCPVPHSLGPTSMVRSQPGMPGSPHTWSSTSFLVSYSLCSYLGPHG